MANLLFCEMLTAVDKKNKDLAKGKQPIPVLFPRFISVVIRRAIERYSLTEEGPRTLLFIMNSFKPTMVPPYPNERRFPQTMLQYIPTDSDTRLFLSRVAQPSEPMVRSPTHLGSEPELESESDISDTAQNIHREQPEGGSEGESESPPKGEFLNLESERGEVEKDALDGINERFQNPTPRATISTIQGVPAPMDIETEVHTSSPSQANLSKVSYSSSEAWTKGEPSDMAKSSQQDLDQHKSTHSPQSTPPPHTHDASVAHNIKDCPLVHKRLQISRKDCLFSSSSTSDSDDNRPIRTIIEKSSKKDSQRLMGSPSGANINTTPKEGPSVLEGSLTDLKLQMEKTSEASASNSEVAKLTSEVSELLTTLHSQSSRLEALEKLVIVNSSVLSREIQESKVELLKAIPPPSAPTPTSKYFSHFKGDVLRILAETITKIPLPTSAPTSPIHSELITKADLHNFSKSITRNMMTISSKFVTKASQQNKTIEDLMKNAISLEGSLKRKAPEVGSSGLQNAEKTPSTKVVESQKESTPSGSNNRDQEKEPERHSTSAEDNQTILALQLPIIFLAPSTSQAPTIQVVNVIPETIRALEEDEDEN
ncbi:hypothetical protein L6452_20154 [Arctium lappa]|uniref:Uncharacterized protein n=1 Tax=Arctium lappa TaxID=4217 RepID=A0ACB9BBG8_ARCLA|nr:hypothetical protein L6452_20154 [Arctium lappa]